MVAPTHKREDYTFEHSLPTPDNTPKYNVVGSTFFTRKADAPAMEVLRAPRMGAILWPQEQREALLKASKDPEFAERFKAAQEEHIMHAFNMYDGHGYDPDHQARYTDAYNKLKGIYTETGMEADAVERVMRLDNQAMYSGIYSASIIQEKQQAQTKAPAPAQKAVNDNPPPHAQVQASGADLMSQMAQAMAGAGR